VGNIVLTIGMPCGRTDNIHRGENLSIRALLDLKLKFDATRQAARADLQYQTRIATSLSISRTMFSTFESEKRIPTQDDPGT
jgi:hypothetical protein